MSLTRNLLARIGGVALITVLLTAIPSFAARGGGGGGRGGGGGGRGGGGFGGGGGRGFGGGYGGYGGYRGGWGGGSRYFGGGFYPGYFGGYGLGGYGLGGYGLGYGGYGGYGGYNYYTPGYDYAPSSTFLITPDVTTTQSSYYAPAAPDDRAHIEVRVPPDAQVLFDGDATRQTGDDRLFVSPPLAQGRTYNYNIEARWMENGKMVDQTKTVTVGPGASQVVDFSR